MLVRFWLTGEDSWLEPCHCSPTVNLAGEELASASGSKTSEFSHGDQLNVFPKWVNAQAMLEKSEKIIKQGTLSKIRMRRQSCGAACRRGTI